MRRFFLFREKQLIAMLWCIYSYLPTRRQHEIAEPANGTNYHRPMLANVRAFHFMSRTYATISARTRTFHSADDRRISIEKSSSLAIYGSQISLKEGKANKSAVARTG